MVQSLKGINEEILRTWEEKVVPSEDLFYFVSQEQVMELIPEHTLVIPQDEFANHNSYQTIDMINS
ncbi:hypothetical protein J6TS2_23120 [Heyndrickxia sporothermodurans]|nr:hypothetical protein J6TS2_23120 [Heyndrickxia sporothermodurans]